MLSPDNKTFYFADPTMSPCMPMTMTSTRAAFPTSACSARPRTIPARSMADRPSVALHLERACLRRAHHTLCAGWQHRPRDRALVRNLTSVMFGGKNLDIMYVTSMGRPG